eukprot:scaffold903_cov262-Pinguiococcus_pyrenoidosus.AAC.6
MEYHSTAKVPVRIDSVATPAALLGPFSRPTAAFGAHLECCALAEVAEASGLQGGGPLRVRRASESRAATEKDGDGAREAPRQPSARIHVWPWAREGVSEDERPPTRREKRRGRALQLPLPVRGPATQSAFGAEEPPTPPARHQWRIRVERGLRERHVPLRGESGGAGGQLGAAHRGGGVRALDGRSGRAAGMGESGAGADAVG